MPRTKRKDEEEEVEEDDESTEETEASEDDDEEEQPRKRTKKAVKNGSPAKVRVPKVSLSEFNPCRLIAKGRPSTRVFWVEELVGASGAKSDHYKSIHERAGKAWAAAMKETGHRLADELPDTSSAESFEDRYNELIPSTPSNTTYMLTTIVAMNKKRGVDSSYEFDEESGIVTFTGGRAKKTRKN